MSDSEHETAPVSDAGSAKFQKVGSLASLRSAGSFGVTIAGRRLAIFAVGHSVVATQGRCPHAKGPLHEGSITAEALTCPWHGYTFSLETGTCDDDPDLLLMRYDVHIDGDDILVRF
jgi:nitrite reductase (NADH) small subunit